jgi:type I restriction enzyme S subunit
MSFKKLSLGELCTITKGTTGIQKAVPGEYPMVVTGEERKSHNEYQFDDEAVIVPLVSGTGHGHASIKRIHYQAGKFALGSILCAIIPKDKTVLNPEYLFRFLDLNRENELVARMRGMANVSLPIKEIAKIEIPVPDLHEQIKFVEQYKILEQSSWEINTELNHQLDLVKQLRQSFLREAMQGKLTGTQIGNEENKETGQQLLEKIKAEKAQLKKDKKLKKEKELPPIKPEETPFEIPEDWVWCRLGTLFQIVRGSSPRPKGDPRYFANKRTEFHWITIADFAKHSRINTLFDTSQFITEEGSKQSRKVTEADLLVAASGVGSVGKSTLVGITGFIYDGIMAIKNITNDDTRAYLSYYLKVKELEIYSIASGANWLNINTDLLNNYLLPLPPLTEQKRIVTKLKGLMEKCIEIETSIKRSQQQNEQLLQQVLREALGVEEVNN